MQSVVKKQPCLSDPMRAATGHDEKLALADSIIYTIAQKNSATLWTQDAHFSQKPAVRYLAKPVI